MTLRASRATLRPSFVRWLCWALVLVGSWTVGGCSFSFTGAALDPSIKTFSIETFPNNSQQGPATLSQTFTEEFRTFVQRNSSLRLDPSGQGDLQFSGIITGYNVQPVNATSQGGVESAGSNRLTITVQVKFVNTKDPKQNFDQPFSQYSDFDRNITATQLDDAFIRDIANRIYQEAFNRSLANW